MIDKLQECSLNFEESIVCLKFLENKITKLFETAKNIKIEQPEKGYRFSIDSTLLAADFIPQDGEYILDIGTGCGVMPLLIAAKYPNTHIIAVEIQKELAEIAQRNIRNNDLCSRIELINSDIKNIEYKNFSNFFKNSQYKHNNTKGFDRVISNPPYKKIGSGRLNLNSQKAIARHELTLTLNELIISAANLLKPDGILNLIYPAERLTELTSAMKFLSIEPTNVKLINNCDIKKNKIKLALVSGVKI